MEDILPRWSRKRAALCCQMVSLFCQYFVVLCCCFQRWLLKWKVSSSYRGFELKFVQKHAVWFWEFFRCTCWHMSTVRVKAIPFCKLLVKWIDNRATYFNSIAAQMLNTVMQHSFSKSTGIFSGCKLLLEDIC